MTDSFPRQQARTRGFSLGVPRSFQISPDGSRVAFLRSRGGSDPVTCLWVLDVATGEERLVADPAAVASGDDNLTEEEKARRERAREKAAGIVAYATDSALSVAAFVLAGRVYVAELTGPPAAPPVDPPPGASPAGPPPGASPAAAPTAGVRPIGARSPALDPRPDPLGQRVAYVCDGALRVTDLRTGTDRQVIGPDRPGEATYGLAEFIAAEEMHRMRGYWWAPDGAALLVARVDESQVRRLYIADPAHPERPPTEVAYPAAGTANADVSLLLAGLDGTRAEVEWDRAGFPYLVTVAWEEGGPLIVVQSRDQRRMRLLAPALDGAATSAAATGETATGGTVTGAPAGGTATAAAEIVREETGQHWVDIVPGVPARTGDGRIVWAADNGAARRLLVATAAELADGSAKPVTPPDLQVRDVAGVDGDAVLFTASQDEPAEIGLWLYRPAGLVQLTTEPGVHDGSRAGGTTVITSRSLAGPGARVRVLRDGQPGPVEITSLAEHPDLPAPHPDLFAAGPHAIRTALLLPSWHEPGSGALPVLLDPYGGPGAQRVLAARGAYLTSQWFAEQGFAVVIADGRGTPGRGPEWDRAVAGDLASPAVEDQVEALRVAAERCADLDTGRVAIRGWSFGGYLAALAVLRRPDVFHAAVAGAPVTEWRLYDTHYTERYLGDPAERGADYDACSVLRDAHLLRRPLMIIHGLADDNVMVAHSLRLSSALLAAGRPHAMLPLSGVTHMTPQEDVAENLLLLQVDFLRRALGM